MNFLWWTPWEDRISLCPYSHWRHNTNTFLLCYVSYGFLKFVFSNKCSSPGKRQNECEACCEWQQLDWNWSKIDICETLKAGHLNWKYIKPRLTWNFNNVVQNKFTLCQLNNQHVHRLLTNDSFSSLSSP